MRIATVGPSVICIAMLIAPALHAQKPVTINVCHRTVVAFFKPAANSQAEKENGYNESLSDFQFYNGTVEQLLKDKGITLRVVYAAEFRTRCGKHTSVFNSGKNTVGYYFVNSGKNPRVEYGVTSDVDLLHIADEYFGKP